MNRKTIIAGFALAAAFAAVAMPTRKELTDAKRLVDEVTAPELQALKLKKKTAKEVADFHMQQAKTASTEAERFHLLQGAFRLYARGKDYETAAEALSVMNREIKNLPPEVVVELVQKEMRRVTGEKAPKVLAIFNAARRLVKFRKELPRLEAAVKAKPDNAVMQLKLGECYAEVGKWPEALAAFAKSGNQCGKIAKGELDGSIPPQTLADFWWDYGNPGDDDEISVYRVHAAELYAKALADTTFTGLKKTRAEMRIAKAKGDRDEGDEADAASGTSGSAFQIKGNEATLDLGEKYGKLEFVKCLAGMVKVVENKQGKLRKVKISRDFWIMKTPTTALQNSFAPSLGEYGHLSRKMTDDLTDYMTSYFSDDLPKGMVVRLPTIAEWEYAYHANSKDKKDPFYNLCDVGGADNWHKTMTVKLANGKTRMNKWGLHDFATWERVLDKFPREVFASQGWDPVKNDRKQKGGWFHAKECPLPAGSEDVFSWTEDNESLIVCRSARHTGWFVDKSPADDWGPVIRLVIGPDLVKEWKEKQAKNKKK